MARARPTGLTTPRVDNAELQRFLNQVSQRLAGLPNEIGTSRGDRTAGSGGTTSGGTPGGTDPRSGGFLPTIPTLDVPPQPVGVQAFCGIGIVVLSWENPWRFYINHGRTIVYRGTTDRFDESVQIGQAAYFVFADETGLDASTEYFYWIRFVSETNVEGPLSDVASCTTAADPEEVYEAIIAWLETSPLLEALQSDITNPAFVLEEIRRVAALVNVLTASAAQAADEAAALAKTAADNAQTAADNAQTAADTANTAATTAAAEALVALNSANASQVSANQALEEAAQLLADIGSLERIDRLIVWIDGAGRNTRFAADVVEGSTIDIGIDATDTTDDVTVNVLVIRGFNSFSNRWFYIIDLQAKVVDWSVDLWIRSSGNDFSLSQANRTPDAFNDGEWYVEEDVARFPLQQQITTLSTTVDGKADATAIMGLDTRITTNADLIAAQATQITSLEARLTGTSLGPAVNEFTGTDREAAESVRDAYFALNPTNLAVYDADGSLNIRLTFGVLRVFQHRVSNAWVDNGEVEPTAAAISTLNATVMQQGMAIAANSSSITALTAAVDLKADDADLTSGLATKADATALTALRNRVSANENTIVVNQENIALLEAVFDGLELGPPQNTFTGADRDAAEMARDTYFTANADKLAEYDAQLGNPNEDGPSIRLLVGDATLYQGRRRQGRTGLSWGITEADRDVINGFNNAGDVIRFRYAGESDWFDYELRLDAAIVLINGLYRVDFEFFDDRNIDFMGSRSIDIHHSIRNNGGNIERLRVGDRLSVAPPVGTAYQNREWFPSGKGFGDRWTYISADPRASASALTALTNRVIQTESGITTLSSDITSLQGSLAGKADVSALAGLMTSIEENEDAIEVNAQAITSLRTTLSDFVLGPIQNTFVGDARTDAESARDAYATANMSWLTHYNDNTNNYILLEYD